MTTETPVTLTPRELAEILPSFRRAIACAEIADEDLSANPTVIGRILDALEAAWADVARLEDEVFQLKLKLASDSPSAWGHE